MGRRAVALQLDTGNIAAFASFVNRLRAALAETWQRDTFDHLVNNAGHGDYALIADTTEAQFDPPVDVHRLETRREGKEGVSTGKSRGWASHYKKKQKKRSIDQQ